MRQNAHSSDTARAQVVLAILMFFLMLPAYTLANEQSPFDVSAELQVYPTGVIPGIRFERGFSNRHAVHLRLGVQEIRHEDYGEHDDERGNGAGFTLGYRFFKEGGYQGLSFGFKTDLWFNDLDWIDNPGQSNERRGNTKVTVLQPTATVAFLHPLKSGSFISPSFALGFEINIDTNGEDVGEGVIWLLGLNLGKRFN